MSVVQTGGVVTKEAKEKLARTRKKSSQFSSMWTTDGNTNTKINKDAIILGG